MKHGSFFTGIGLLDYGLMRAGFDAPDWVVERDAWRRSILTKRFPDAAQLDDIRAAGADSLPRVDFIAGGFPCKGNSPAGLRNGLDHPETVLWHEMARAIRELRPRYVLVENVRDVLSVRGGAVWAQVLGDLAESGFDVEWDCIPAAAVGAPHLRDRVFAVATHPDPAGGDEPRQRAGEGVGRARRRGEPEAGDCDVADASRARLEGTGLRGRPAEHAARASADTDTDDGRQPQQSQRDGERRRGLDGSLGNDVVGRGARFGRAGDDVAPDADERELSAGRDGGRADGDQAGARPVAAVDWGIYERAVRRWEQVHGPAPEPLLRGVDARPAARVVRSRLSALGDGVQIQCAEIAGRYILEREAERMRAAAA